MPGVGTVRDEGDDVHLATTQWAQERAHFVSAGNQNSLQVVGRALGWCGVGRAKTRAGRSAPPRRAAEESAVVWALEQHPLAHRQAGEHMVAQVRRGLHSAAVLHEGQTPGPLQERATK